MGDATAVQRMGCLKNIKNGCCKGFMKNKERRRSGKR